MKGGKIIKATKKKERKLIRLINSRCDGGHGEFEEFLPRDLLEKAMKYDHSYMPTIEKGKVVWVQVF